MNNEALVARRRFFFGAGAVMAAPLVLTATQAHAASAEDRNALAARVAALEHAQAIRELQRAYLRYVNAREHAAAAALHAHPDRARFDETIRSIVEDDASDSAGVVVGADGREAVAHTACVVTVETVIDGPGCALVDMARAQGEGVVRHAERRSLEQTFVRRDGIWRIEGTVLVAG